MIDVIKQTMSIATFNIFFGKLVSQKYEIFCTDTDHVTINMINRPQP